MQYGILWSSRTSFLAVVTCTDVSWAPGQRLTVLEQSGRGSTAWNVQTSSGKPSFPSWLMPTFAGVIWLIQTMAYTMGKTAHLGHLVNRHPPFRRAVRLRVLTLFLPTRHSLNPLMEWRLRRRLCPLKGASARQQTAVSTISRSKSSTSGPSVVVSGSVVRHTRHLSSRPWSFTATLARPPCIHRSQSLSVPSSSSAGYGYSWLRTASRPS